MKSCNVNQATKNKAWIGKVISGKNFSLSILHNLWSFGYTCKMCNLMKTQKTTLIGISRKKSNTRSSGLWSAILELISFITYKTVWKAWATPKAKIKTLLLQNRICTANRLQNRGWPNCRLCPFYKQETHSVFILSPLLATLSLFGNLSKIGWASKTFIQTNRWIHPNHKAIATLALLVTLEVWNECNARVSTISMWHPL
jgi:hypothetical protein